MLGRLCCILPLGSVLRVVVMCIVVVGFRGSFAVVRNVCSLRLLGWRSAKRLRGGTAAKKSYEDSPSKSPEPGDHDIDLVAEAEAAYKEVPEYLRLQEGQVRGKWNYTVRMLGLKGSVQVQCGA